MSSLPGRATARVRVDLDALASNHRLLKDQAAGAEVAPVVKADGYGLGAAECAARLWAEGARCFFTARVSGGEQLRAALGPSRPATIFVLDGCPPGMAARLKAADLVPALSSLEQIQAWRAQASGDERLKAALHVDTGMNRLGVRPEEADDLLRTGGLDGLELQLVMSHLACAGEPDHPMNARQAALFREVRGRFPDVRASLANSGGTFLGPDFRYELVRPGVVLYGGGPQERPDPRVKAVATLEAEILQVREALPGETVGYGASFTAERPTRLAILGIGYADGVLRSSQGRGAAFYAGERRPIAGRVSMDLTTLDVTGCADAKAGDFVELFGPNLPLDEAAAAAGTLAYELITRLGGRVDRIYEGKRG